MGFTYTVASIATSDLFKVRFLLQDTTNTTARPNLMDDAEINWVLTTEANVYMAAALCADALASRFRGTASKKVGNLELRYSHEYWDGVAKKLRARGSSHQVISAGGVYVADRDASFENADVIQPEMFTGMMEDPTAQGPSRSTDLAEEEQ